ncbi:hypothetical protein [Pseudomonas subflava]|uniref:hypothetical protein n=1 Tax=Pseudomonas subflava TaxID=2952933 RepID=UPI00207A7A5C|nr:hypothetical protein [Pseudomonas subflava]
MVLLFAGYTHLTNPEGILLYTPPADGARPRGTPAFALGLVIGFGLSALVSLALLLPGVLGGYLAHRIGAAMVVDAMNRYCLAAFAAAAASLLGCLCALAFL